MQNLASVERTMHMTQIDAVLWALSVLGQLLLLFVFFHRRLYRTFPVFFSYLLYSCCSDLLFTYLVRHSSESTYFKAYFANNVPEFLLQLGILVEVAWNVLNPIRRSLPKSSLYVLIAMVVSGTLLALLLAVFSRETDVKSWSQVFLQVNFGVAILRLVIFSAIALFAQMLGISWKNHVFQIATGIASYSILVLLIELAHRHTGAADDSRYHLLEQFRVAGWCMALGYLSYALEKKEAPRREFSPKMESFLVSISEAARENRIAATRMYRK
jgi:hypothetical protein